MSDPIQKEITIEVTLSVCIKVTAQQDANGGEVKIVSVRDVDLPSINEIYESMGEDDFKAMDEAFKNAKA